MDGWMLGICFFTLGEITLKAPLQEGEKGVGLWTGNNGAVTYSFDQSLGDLTVTAIPEPGASLLGLVGALLLLRRRK